MFDTAPSYGDGEAERRLGEVISGLPREQCILSSKFGHGRSAEGRRIRDFSPEGLHRSLDATLSRLRTSYVDWLFLHGPAPRELTDTLMTALDRETKDGRIRQIGVAGRGAEVQAACASGLITLAMTPSHADLPLESHRRLDELRSSGVRIVGIETLSPALRRWKPPATAGDVFRLARALTGRQSHIPAPTMTVRDALAWAMGRDPSDIALVTTSSLRHLSEILEAAETLAASA